MTVRSTNLVTDPGFESGLAAWAIGDTRSIADSVDIGIDSNAEDVHSGNNGIFAGNDTTTTLSQILATNVGQAYKVSFYLDVYQADATDGRLTLAFGGEPVAILSEPAETDQNANPWTLYTATVTASSTATALEFSFIDPPGFFGLDDVSVTLACFAQGTRIDTETGAVCVEALRAGDRVRLADGGCAPVRRVGRQVVACDAHPLPASVRPFRIAPHAFGRNRPRRALLLSPDHAVAAEGVLIPVKYLANGTTIRQLPAATVTYYHIELDRHDVVLAEGLPAESFLRTSQLPGQACLMHDAAGYAPLVVAGTPVSRVRQLLAQQAGGIAQAIR